MRMYLSSYKFGNHKDALKELATGVERVAIIMNALDFGDQDRVTQTVMGLKGEFSEMGFAAERLDLRDYFGKEDSLREKMSEFGMVWVCGGNAFLLKRAYEQSGFGNILVERLKEDSLVYAGFSAAVVVITPTLRGAEIVDDPNVIVPLYKDEIDLNGLGLINYAVAVHYKSDHPESAAVDKYVEFCEKENIPYKPLRDGEVIYINGAEEIILK